MTKKWKVTHCFYIRPKTYKNGKSNLTKISIELLWESPLRFCAHAQFDLVVKKFTIGEEIGPTHRFLRHYPLVVISFHGVYSVSSSLTSDPTWHGCRLYKRARATTCSLLSLPQGAACNPRWCARPLTDLCYFLRRLCCRRWIKEAPSKILHGIFSFYELIQFRQKEKLLRMIYTNLSHIYSKLC